MPDDALHAESTAVATAHGCRRVAGTRRPAALADDRVATDRLPLGGHARRRTGAAAHAPADRASGWRLPDPVVRRGVQRHRPLVPAATAGALRQWLLDDS